MIAPLNKLLRLAGSAASMVMTQFPQLQAEQLLQDKEASRRLVQRHSFVALAS
jgi:hypothetical protein